MTSGNTGQRPANATRHGCSHLLVIGVLYIHCELFADSIHDHAGDMVHTVRQLGVLRGDGDGVLGIVQLGRNVQALYGVLGFVVDNGD